MGQFDPQINTKPTCGSADRLSHVGPSAPVHPARSGLWPKRSALHGSFPKAPALLRRGHHIDIEQRHAVEETLS
jgi:hypothetical protein